MSHPQFSEMVKTALGVYVYALLDPRMKMAIRERVFYVGKGTGNRAFNHARLEKEAVRSCWSRDTFWVDYSFSRSALCGPSVHGCREAGD